MNNEKLAKSIIEKILKHPIDINNNNYIGMKRILPFSDKNEKSVMLKTNKTKFSELPIEVEVNILQFLDIETRQRDILKYAMIDKQHLESFRYNSNNDYVIALKESIIYDAKDLSRFMLPKFKILNDIMVIKKNDKTNNDELNEELNKKIHNLFFEIYGVLGYVRKIRYITNTLDYYTYENIIKHKYILEQKLKLKNTIKETKPITYLDVKMNSNSDELSIILSNWNYLSELKTLILNGFGLSVNLGDFEGFKFIETVKLYNIYFTYDKYKYFNGIKNFTHIDKNNKLFSMRIENYMTTDDLKELGLINNNGKEIYSLEKFKSSYYLLNVDSIKYLQNVKVFDCHINIQNNMDMLKQLKNVVKLKLFSYEKSEYPLYVSDYFKNLKKLKLENIDIEFRDDFECFKHVRDLTLNRSYFDTKNLKYFNNIKNFKCLLGDEGGEIDFITINELKSLSYSNYNGKETYSLEKFKTNFYNLAIGGIKYLQNVKELKCEITIEKNMDELKYLKNVVDLELICVNEENSKETLYLVDYIKNIKKLKINNEYNIKSKISPLGLEELTDLYIRLGYYNSKDFSVLKSLKKIAFDVIYFENDEIDFRFIDGFNGNTVENISIIKAESTHLNNMLLAFKNVKHLELTGAIEDNEIIPILENVEFFILYYDVNNCDEFLNKKNKLTNNIFKYMKNMKEIEIYGCNTISDDGIETLINIAPNLRKMRINSLGITKKFKKKYEMYYPKFQFK
jgi:hypothetical protein